MATPVTYAGVSYSIPAFGDVGYAQGPGNLSSYLIALAGGPQTTGGLFSLTAPLNFGPNFGLIAVNYTTTTALPATAGQIRLAKTDTIDWRNNANTLNLPLGINGSDQLTFNGTVIGLVGGSVTSVTGTANQINSTGGTTPVLSLSSTLIIPGTFTIPAVTNQIILGTTNTVTITSPAPAASRVYTIPDVLGAASFVMTAGVQTIAGVKTFSGGAGGITMSASTIAMGANKITGLANGTAATDAMAFGQNKVVQYVTATTATDFTTTSVTFQTTNLTASITPTSASNKILIFAFSTMQVQTANKVVFASLYNGSSNLMAANGQAITGGGANMQTAVALGWLDSPASTSAQTYSVKIRNNDGATSVVFGNSTTQFIILIEVTP